MAINKPQRLTSIGNRLALVIEPAILEATGIGPETPLDVSTDGDVIVVSPVRGGERSRKLRRALENMAERYSPVFRRLAD